MKLFITLYITKPLHTKYGSIPLENPFESVDALINNSTIWFKKPKFEKPFMDIFGGGFCIRNWWCFDRCGIVFSKFPEGSVKEHIYNLIKNTIEPDFHEGIKNRHHKWIGEVNIELIRKKNSGNFNLHLIKPSSVWDIQYAGIDRCKIFLEKPALPLYTENNYTNYIDGKVFRQTPELEEFAIEMWDHVKNSFNFSDDDHFDFLMRITDKNHKDNQGCRDFIREFFFDIQIKK